MPTWKHLYNLERPKGQAVMKLLGACVLLIGLGMMVFAVGAYSELRAAATSVTPPSPEAMPLTRIVGPELFDTAKAGTKPAELASMAMNRIYMIGGASLVLLAVGALLLVLKQSPKSHVMLPDAAEPT